MSMLTRIRPDLAAFATYPSARRSGFEAAIHLDANECPWDSEGNDGAISEAGLNRYPSPQPEDLRQRMAELYGVNPRRLWLGRGSDEAIDLLLRAFCCAGIDNIVAHAPTFGMYRVGAQLQGAEYRALPLDAGSDFALDAQGLLDFTDENTKLVVLCSPNNPTGTLHHGAALGWLAERLAGRALLLVDEAYIEFAGIVSATELLDRHDNLVVLRTLSKAHALAGARIGALIAAEDIIDLIGRIAAPYPLPTPSVHVGLAALGDDAQARTRQRIALLIEERERLATALRRAPEVDKVWPSAGNFLLVRFSDARAMFRRLLDAGILVRDFSSQAGLEQCLRISVGRPDENDALLAACGVEDKVSA